MHPMPHILQRTMANFKPAKISRQDPRPLSDAIPAFVRVNGLGKGLASRLVFDIWDEVSGAAGYSTNKFFRDGVLNVTISSSVVRSQLLFQLDIIKDRINKSLKDNESAKMFGLGDIEVKTIRLR